LNTSLILISLLLLLKIFCWVLEKKYGYAIPLATITVTRFHVMLMGVVAAILYYQENKLFLQVSTHKAAQALAWIGLLFIAMNKFHFASVIDGELVALISVVLIMGQVTKRNLIINLENRVCDFIGKISYGIYVIHPLLIFYVAQITGKFSNETFIGYLFVYATILLSTIIMAYLSYTYYEKPFLRWKQKFTTIKSAASMQRS
jgi:peptidoglycan/LPS O-acetylase OafA/YrhL